MKDVRGKVAVVTGGTSGIGFGIAKALANAGAQVVMTYRTGRHLDAVSLYRDNNPELVMLPLQVDAADRHAMEELARQVKRDFGGVHILCNNAGVGVMSSISDSTYDDWDWSLSVNIGGVVNGIKSFLPKILEQDVGGHIVTTSSIGGIFLGGGSGVYNTTKYALVGMMESLRWELRDHNIGVSVFCPGLVDTNIHETESVRPDRYADTKPRLNREQLESFKQRILSAGMTPEEAGEIVLAGIIRSDLYILSHPEFYDGAKERFDAILAAFRGDMSHVPRGRLEAQASTMRHPLYGTELARNRITN